MRRSHEDWVHLTKRPRYYSAVDEIRVPQKTADRQGTWNGTPQEGRTDGVSRDRGWQAGELNYNPLGALPGSVWNIATEPLKVPDHLGVDHFAAYPSEWPRRLILGWSPPGVCTECGAGRRPVSAAGEIVSSRSGDVLLGGEGNRRSLEGRKTAGRDDGGAYVRMSGGHGFAKRERTITGYACDCPEPDAPTRPAVVLDPFSGTGTTIAVASALGRVGIGVDLSHDYNRLAQWRVNDPALRAKVQGRVWKDRQGVLL